MKAFMCWYFTPNRLFNKFC